jgi:hypothetical protein
VSHPQCRVALEGLCRHLPHFHDESFTRESMVFDTTQTAACAGRDDAGLITERAAETL